MLVKLWKTPNPAILLRPAAAAHFHNHHPNRSANRRIEADHKPDHIADSGGP
ncbi:MAG TPA: hypothetical protein VMV15_04790 [Candidatus Binataceae bacterium]|nr:hypothetical protein [Candidatus Binataceae bacterium]